MKLVGFSISGRITANTHMQTIRTMVRACHNRGFGVMAACLTKGDREVLSYGNTLGAHTVGLFADQLCWLNMKEKCSREVNKYDPWKFEMVKRMYDSAGKNWGYLMPNQQKCFVMGVDLVMFSSLVVIWPETVQTNLVAMLAANFKREVCEMPGELGKFLIALNSTQFTK